MVSYVRIKNDQVDNRHTFSASDSLKIQKLVAHDYKEEDNSPPSFDSSYESLDDANPKWVVVDGKWQKQYVVNDKISLDDAKTLKKGALKAEAQVHFEATYDYMNILALLKTDADKTRFDLDYAAVVAHFITKRDEVNACANIACVKAVTASWPDLPT